MERTKGSGVAALALFTGSVVGAALFGGRFNPGRGDTEAWYRALEKPSFNPPDAIFPIVWTALYAVMVVAAFRTWRRPPSADRTRALAAWWTQLALNAAWSPLFFGAKRPDLALIDIGLLIAAVVAFIVWSRRVDRPASLMMLPYLGWISFAALLNEEILRLNS